MRRHVLQIEFKADLVLLDEFAQTFLVRENRLVKNFCKNIRHFGELRLERLDVNSKTRRK